MISSFVKQSEYGFYKFEILKPRMGLEKLLSDVSKTCENLEQEIVGPPESNQSSNEINHLRMNCDFPFRAWQMWKSKHERQQSLHQQRCILKTLSQISMQYHKHPRAGFKCRMG